MPEHPEQTFGTVGWGHHRVVGPSAAVVVQMEEEHSSEVRSNAVGEVDTRDIPDGGDGGGGDGDADAVGTPEGDSLAEGTPLEAVGILLVVDRDTFFFLGIQ
jgi:hypothetical protein